ncbi:hypothetical protein I317_06881, partial [Kwoniella heveanensis CBS 569]
TLPPSPPPTHFPTSTATAITLPPNEPLRATVNPTSTLILWLDLDHWTVLPRELLLVLRVLLRILPVQEADRRRKNMDDLAPVRTGT